MEKLRQKRRGKTGASKESGKPGNKDFNAKEDDEESPKDNTPVGRCIEAFKQDPRPRKIGNVYCYWYN